MFTKKSYMLSDSTQKAELINETENALPKTGFQSDTLMSLCGCLALFRSMRHRRCQISLERNLAHINSETHLSFAMDILTTSNYLTEEIISMQKGINGTTHFFMSDSSPFISKYRIIFKIFERSKTWKSKNRCKTDRQSSYRGQASFKSLCFMIWVIYQFSEKIRHYVT